MSSIVYVAKPGAPRKNANCYRCGKPILEGQQIMVRSQKCKRKYYHLECWESMFLDV